MPEFVYPILGISLVFICTTIGSLVVFFIRNLQISANLNKIFIGFASGIMLSASFFSLIKPALESNVSYMPTWAVLPFQLFLEQGSCG